MNQGRPEEGPEHRTQTLSPVSPKPLHYPSPSNIPILENQMDADYDASPNQRDENHNNLSHQEQEQHVAGASADPSEPASSIIRGGFADGAADLPTSAGSGRGLTSSIDPTIGTGASNEASSTNPFAPSNDAPDPSSHYLSEAGYTSQHSATFHPSESFNNSTLPHHDQSAQFEASNGNYQGAQSYASDGSQQVSYDNGQMGGIDYQALMENFASSASSAQQGQGTDASPSNYGQSNSNATPVSQSSAMSSHAGKVPTPLLPGTATLPPRPPPQDNSNTYAVGGDIRSYHLHTQTQQAQQQQQQQMQTPHNMPLQTPQGAPPPLLTAGAPGTVLPSPNGLPPPPVATFQQPPSASATTQPIPTLPSYKSLQQQQDPGEALLSDEDGDIRWSQDTQRQYDAFLSEERMYVTEGQWDKFPVNSRLFIGNLPTEKVTKRDLFHVFHRHGKLAQISIKQAYGFIQYLDSASCLRALQEEQSVFIRGRKVHLEISKPQRGQKNQSQQNNTNPNTNADGRNSRGRRSGSPDYTKGGTNQGNQRMDRYRGGNNQNNNNNRQNNAGRGRDDYRPARSPSPRRSGRDEYRGGRDRSRDRFNGRRRSRSRSPHGRGNRYRSRSPTDEVDDNLPLPPRRPQDVPDIQIIAKDEPEGNFLRFVENTFEQRGVRASVLMLSPKLDEPSVVRRQIVEGVLAVMKINRATQSTQKFSISVFNRSGGATNVRFEEYNDLDLNVCVELVFRAKQTHRAPVASTNVSPYGLPFSQQQQQSPSNPSFSPQSPLTAGGIPPPPQPIQGNMSNMLSSLDTTSLQQLLGRIQSQPPSASQQHAQFSPPPNQPPTPSSAVLPSSTTDLSKLLAGGLQPQQRPQSQQHNISAPQYPNLAANPAFAGLFNQQGSQPNPPLSASQQAQNPTANNPSQQKPPTQDMQSIMDALARYQR